MRDPGRSDGQDCNALPDEEFRRQFGHWLDTHYPPEFCQDHRRPFRRLRGEDHRRWVRMLYEAGWRAPAWPREAGGMGLSFRKQMVYQQEMERIGAARMIDNGETQLGPTLIHCGSEAQRREYLPKILSGEQVWAQGYSEPNAGSDLASLRTRAVRDGDGFVVDGQKIWTTHAQECTHIFTLVRTGAPGQYAKKQQGISFVLIDLSLPGITIRPIVTIAGESELCEVFFDGVRVPATNIVGEIDRGWDVAKALLGHERVWLGSAAMAARALKLAHLMVLETGQQEDTGVMDRLAQLTADLHDYKLLYAQVCDEIAIDDTQPGPEVSMLKIYISELQQRITEFNAEVAGEYGGVVGDVEVGDTLTDLHWQLMMARPVTIFAGCNEVQRDILAKAVLHMPES
ncbi:acyl-CoA dehydrogenase family protein [Paraburkholderia phymatum]|uniref:acyl-CoA dehydrogenase family protein n=1 Tax=Paraburkholderia phymatum TaxID=148447 RepID=UPI00316C43E9